MTDHPKSRRVRIVSGEVVAVNVGRGHIEFQPGWTGPVAAEVADYLETRPDLAEVWRDGEPPERSPILETMNAGTFRVAVGEDGPRFEDVTETEPPPSVSRRQARPLGIPRACAGGVAQMTHRKHHTHVKPLTAAEWKARYAEICKQYPDVPKAKRFDPEAVRQWEELNHAIQNPKPNTWRVVKIPDDPSFAFAAIYSHVAGMDSAKDL